MSTRTIVTRTRELIRGRQIRYFDETSVDPWDAPLRRKLLPLLVLTSHVAAVNLVIYLIVLQVSTTVHGSDVIAIALFLWFFFQLLAAIFGLGRCGRDLLFPSAGCGVGCLRNLCWNRRTHLSGSPRRSRQRSSHN